MGHCQEFPRKVRKISDICKKPNSCQICGTYLGMFVCHLCFQKSFAYLFGFFIHLRVTWIDYPGAMFHCSDDRNPNPFLTPHMPSPTEHSLVPPEKNGENRV